MIVRLVLAYVMAVTSVLAASWTAQVLSRSATQICTLMGLGGVQRDSQQTPLPMSGDECVAHCLGQGALSPFILIALTLGLLSPDTIGRVRIKPAAIARRSRTPAAARGPPA